MTKQKKNLFFWEQIDKSVCSLPPVIFFLFGQLFVELDLEEEMGHQIINNLKIIEVIYDNVFVTVFSLSTSLLFLQPKI